MLRALLLLAAVHAAACAAPGTPEVSRGSDEELARTIVWYEIFAAETEPPEVVWWYETCPEVGNPDAPGKPEDTPGNKPDTRTAVYIDGHCYSGLFRPHLWRADVAWRGSFSTSAYAHELMHAWQAERGIRDPQHKNDEWLEVPAIDAELAAAGL